jgi:hypothetical protein
VNEDGERGRWSERGWGGSEDDGVNEDGEFVKVKEGVRAVEGVRVGEGVRVEGEQLECIPFPKKRSGTPDGEGRRAAGPYS